MLREESQQKFMLLTGVILTQTIDGKWLYVNELIPIVRKNVVARKWLIVVEFKVLYKQ